MSRRGWRTCSGTLGPSASPLLPEGPSYAFLAAPVFHRGERVVNFFLNQGQGGMCIRLRRGIGLGIWQECFGP